jgi:prophage regulatory protein
MNRSNNCQQPTPGINSRTRAQPAPHADDGRNTLQELIQKASKATDIRILRLPQVASKLGRATSTIWKDVADGVFVPPISVGPRSVGWIESEVNIWIEAQVLNSRTPQKIDMKSLVLELIASKRGQ